MIGSDTSKSLPAWWWILFVTNFSSLLCSGSKYLVICSSLPTNCLPFCNPLGLCHFPTCISARLTSLLGTKIPASRKSTTVDIGPNAVVSFGNLQGVGSVRQTNPSHHAGCASCPFNTHVPMVSRPASPGLGSVMRFGNVTVNSLRHKLFLSILVFLS